MSKRFVDTNLHKKVWFQNLRWQLKQAWHVICSECCTIGIWEINLKMLNATIGNDEAPITLDELKESFGDRLMVFEGDKIWLTGFVKFQYCDPSGRLSPENYFHLSIAEKLKARGLPVPDFKPPNPKKKKSSEGVDTLSTGEGSPQGKGLGISKGINEGGTGETNPMAHYESEAEILFAGRRLFPSNPEKFKHYIHPERAEILDKIGGIKFLNGLPDDIWSVRRLAKLLKAYDENNSKVGA
jgi:hypothetical protein